MPHFRYQALNANQQSVAGELQADTVQQAIAQLEAAGLAVQSISYAPSAPAAGGGTSEVERAVLESHMATVLEQARAITPALAAYADEMPGGRRRRELRTVCSVAEGGDAAEATRALEALPEYWIPLLSAAASSRDPGRVLQEFLAESHRADELRRQRWAMLAYPLAVVGIATVVLTVISYLVTPIFIDIFEDFGLWLPHLTLAVIAVSRWITSGGILIIAAVVAVVGLAMLAGRLSIASAAVARLGMPWGWGRSTAIARFARFTADLLEAGLDIPNALRVAGFTTRRRRLQRAAWCLASDLERDGAAPVQPAHRPLTVAVLYALRADMAAPSRIRLLREIGDCHAGRARIRLSWTYGIIEPMAIMVVGAIVAAVVLALFLPLISLIQNLSG